MEFKKLSKEQLAQAAKCTTEEERIAFLSRNQIQLPDEMLNKISGGSGSEDYYCSICNIHFDNWLDSLIHDFKHSTL